jgi:hypothetical protein
MLAGTVKAIHNLPSVQEQLLLTHFKFTGNRRSQMYGYLVGKNFASFVRSQTDMQQFR